MNTKDLVVRSIVNMTVGGLTSYILNSPIFVGLAVGLIVTGIFTYIKRNNA